MFELSANEAALRVFLAIALGSIVGLERELSQHPAGLRTHILVCLGACIFTILSITDMTHVLSTSGGMPLNGLMHNQQDPSRIAAQIVSGIGFIGGGAVLRHGASIRGLTTAASLWTMAGIGMLAGSGHYQLAIICTLLAFLVLFTIGNLEHTIFQKNVKQFNRLRMQVTVSSSQSDEVMDWVEETFSTDVIEFKSSINQVDQVSMLHYEVSIRGRVVNVHDLTNHLNRMPGVETASIQLYFQGDQS